MLSVFRTFHLGSDFLQLVFFTKTCKVAPVIDRRLSHLLTFMHKQKHDEELLKIPGIITRLHSAPVFDTYKPYNEKARSNVLYRGAIEWNNLAPNDTNLELDDFKQYQKGILLKIINIEDNQ